MGVRKTGVLKLLILIPNFLGIILGMAMIGVSLEVLINTVDKYQIVGDFKQKIRTTSALSLSAGLVLSMVSFLAIYGTLKDNRLTLLTYIVLMSVILPLEVASGTWALLAKDGIKTDLKHHLMQEMSEYNGSISWFNTEIVRVQYHLKCCGVDDYKDWKNATQWTMGGKHSFVPSSCCGIDGSETWNCCIILLLCKYIDI